MKKGFALITVLAVLIMIALGAATVLQSVGSQTNLKSINIREIKDQYIAEVGMQYALWRSRNGSNPASENHDVFDESNPPVLLGTAVIKKTLQTGGGYKIEVEVTHP